MTPGQNVPPDRLVGFAHRLADASAEAITPFFRTSLTVQNKSAAGAYDPVTEADRQAEDAMRALIMANYPGHGIVGEEGGETPGEGRYRWMIDPIDGTRAFIMGSPLWGTLIGLIEDGKPILGVMNQPFTRERFWAVQGQAYLRVGDGEARRLKTRACSDLAKVTLTTTHPDLFSHPAETEAFQALKSRATLTRYGGDCYGYCLLAAGYVDLVVEAGLKPYDVAALIPIIEGAGGVITDWQGEPALSGGRIVAAGDPRVHAQALKVLGRAG
ncbi:MAG TPA: histidinol-phosphatase [Hyphomicrobiaceae bacterium]|nr:histidinol-phosphatase [Hyphomicrobiaceae bacterium]